MFEKKIKYYEKWNEYLLFLKSEIALYSDFKALYIVLIKTSLKADLCQDINNLLYVTESFFEGSACVIIRALVS